MRCRCNVACRVGLVSKQLIPTIKQSTLDELPNSDKDDDDANDEDDELFL